MAWAFFRSSPSNQLRIVCWVKCIILDFLAPICTFLRSKHKTYPDYEYIWHCMRRNVKLSQLENYPSPRAALCLRTLQFCFQTLRRRLLKKKVFKEICWNSSGDKDLASYSMHVNHQRRPDKRHFCLPLFCSCSRDS